MLDKVVLQIPVSIQSVIQKVPPDEANYSPWARQQNYCVDLLKSPFKKAAHEIYLDEDKQLRYEQLNSPWESLPSSFSGMALKFYDAGNQFLHWPYLEIKCSPAKIVQGHNVYGWDDLLTSVKNMFELLNHYYPNMFSNDKQIGYLDFSNTRLTEIDICYSYRVKNPAHRHSFIQLLHTLSNGQTKATGESYKTTSYFGSKKSRVKKIKIYLKGAEVKQNMKKNKEILTPELQQLADEMIRVELTLKKEWFERRNISVKIGDILSESKKDDFYTKLYSAGTKDLFKALNGQEVTLMKDAKIFELIKKEYSETRGKPARLFGFYQAMRSTGYENVKNTFPKSTFARNITDLMAIGISKAVLQNLKPDSDLQVIPLAAIIKMDNLGNHIPNDQSQDMPPIAPILERAEKAA